MSRWTHVNASFRLDSFGSISDSDIINTFGKELSYYDDWPDEIDESKYLPLGSEGTLHMSIWHNPDTSSVPSTTVNVFGDLRDYDDYDSIESWFTRCCQKFCIRQAVCQVDIEGVGEKIFHSEDCTGC